jgi:3'-phosphoadenosine 5'-phosphosulfate sulfotransferase (PAPS reductase)/FAD synthetase
MLPRVNTLKLPAAGPHLPRVPVQKVHVWGGATWPRLDAVAITDRGLAQPYLPSFDVIVFNHSGGKDSTVGLFVLYCLALRLGVADRIVVLHNDLGRIEWPSTASLDAEHGTNFVERFGDRPSAGGLARKQAEAYGLPFFVRSREQGDLLQQVEQRGMWPSAAQRYCTSDHKRAPKMKFLTERTRLQALARPVRILDVNGERAEESTARARKPEFELNERASNKTRRTVWTWRVIHEMTEEQVWDTHFENDLEWHWAYDAGMSRLSCSLCVLASKKDLTIAATLRPDLAEEYAAIEERIGHTFKNGLSMRQIITDARAVAA